MAVKTWTSERVTSADINTYLTNSGLVYVTQQTIGTSVASVTVPNAFSTNMDNYRVLITNVQVSSAGGLCIQVGNISGSVYYGNLNYQLYTSTTLTVEAYNAATRMVVALSASTDDLLFSSFDLANAFLAKSKTLHGTYYGRGYTGQFGALVLSATSQTSLTVFNTSGTLTGGTVTVYGYRKA
jgi:hypothetical protein